MTYFEWTFSRDRSDAWLLSEPTLPTGKVVSAWNFKRCVRFVEPVDELVAPVREAGHKTHASFGAFDILYVSSPLAAMLNEMCGSQIQLIPAKVEVSGDEIFIVNALRELKCIDEKRSRYTKFEDNGIRPDKIGQYSGFFELRVDAGMCDGLDIFRPWGWHQALIVSERVREAAERLGVEATIFRSVG